MGTIRRILWLGAWSLVCSCFGGPTSDWPRGAEDSDDDKKPDEGAGGPTGPISGDAGVALHDAGMASGCVPLAMDEGGVRLAPPILDDVPLGDAAPHDDAALHDAAVDASSSDDGSASEAGAGSVNDAGAPDATCAR